MQWSQLVALVLFRALVEFPCFLPLTFCSSASTFLGVRSQNTWYRIIALITYMGFITSVYANLSM